MLRTTGIGAAIAFGAAVGVDRWSASRFVRADLHAQTVALLGPDRPVEVGMVGQPGLDALVAGTRVLRDAASSTSLVAAERAWLAGGSDWTRAPGRWADLTRTALLDLHSLSLPDGSQVAGWSPSWRYVWPRDCAHVAAALVATGRAAQAAEIVRWFSAVQADDGWFEARYRPSGSGSPDDRPRQLDGTGWALWAAASVVAALPPTSGRALANSVQPMVQRGADLILTLTKDGTALPPAGPDYWEVPEDSVTLGTVAPLVLGLRSAATVFAVLGDGARAASAQAAGARLGERTSTTFGRQGFPRHLGADDPDAAVAFLAPPYAGRVDASVAAALPESERRMRRAAGGVAPGSSWRNDGISWTPETALFALAYAGCGRRADAERLLGWLEAHRTSGGSLPEKVLYDGSPAAVAPLGWTAALVLLTLDQLRRSTP